MVYNWLQYNITWAQNVGILKDKRLLLCAAVSVALQCRSVPHGSVQALATRRGDATTSPATNTPLPPKHTLCEQNIPRSVSIS